MHPWRHNSNNVGGVIAGQARHNSSNVGVSLRARWDTTLVKINVAKEISTINVGREKRR